MIKKSLINQPKKEGIIKVKSSYIYFCSEERKNISTENLNLTKKEIISELGSRWKKIKDENGEKLKYYTNLSVLDKERCIKENNEEDILIDINSKNVKSKKVKPDIDSTKTVINGYINYCKNKRNNLKNDNPGLSPIEITRLLGANWKSLSPDEKETYRNVKKEEQKE